METTWLSKAVSFNPAIISESDRVISGIATSPIYDRENEKITQEAIQKALAYYMEIPTLTLNHTERPVGIVTKAEFDDSGRLLVEARIGKSVACDDVWTLIKSGVLNSFSIFGRRIESDCKGDGRACVTKGLFLDSITICSVPCNPEAKFVVKGDTMSEEVKDVVPEVTLEKSDNDTDIKDDVLAGKLDEITSVIKALGDTTTTLNAKLDALTVAKSEEKDDKEEEKKEEDDVKKSLADLASKLASIDSRLQVIENSPLKKAVITIDETGTPAGSDSLNHSAPIESYVKHMFKGSKL